MKRGNQDLYGTNFDFLKRSFPDLIDTIENEAAPDSNGTRSYAS